MASILRQIVAGPRSRHPEANLDLCYVTDNIIATSGPSSTYPQRAYRNPTEALVKFLDYKHGTNWSIWEFRAEGTGYPDSEVYGRIHHFPWPDHHPPPFALMPPLMASMRNWLQGDDEKMEGKKNSKIDRRMAVVHCKAGKGRSGCVACSYLISQEGWNVSDALQRFTDRRMRVGFGAGVSIPSQLRWVGYVDRWANQLNKMYVERRVEIVEIHVWGLRDGVKVAVEGYVEDGRRIEGFHIFHKHERIVMEDDELDSHSQTTESKPPIPWTSPTSPIDRPDTPTITSPTVSTNNLTKALNPGKAVLLRPSKPLILPTSDINIDFERRNKAAYTGWTMVTSVAHVWFNAYFEDGAAGADSGVFEIEWDAMDGIKGSVRKGVRALDRVKVVWRYAEAEGRGDESEKLGRVITQPAKGEPVPEGRAADWRGSDKGGDESSANPEGGVSSGRQGGTGLTIATTMAAAGNAASSSLGKELGLRKESQASASVSRASSVKSARTPVTVGGKTDGGDEVEKKEQEVVDEDYEESLKGVQTHVPDGEGEEGAAGNVEGRKTEDEQSSSGVKDVGMGKVAKAVGGMKKGQ